MRRLDLRTNVDAGFKRALAAERGQKVRRNQLYGLCKDIVKVSPLFEDPQVGGEELYRYHDGVEALEQSGEEGRCHLCSLSYASLTGAEDDSQIVSSSRDQGLPFSINTADLHTSVGIQQRCAVTPNQAATFRLIACLIPRRLLSVNW